MPDGRELPASARSASLVPKYPAVSLGGAHQLVMRTDGGDTALAQHDDQVCPADLGQAVSDEDGRAAAGGVGDGPLDLVFGGGINGGGRVVEDQDAGIGQESAPSARRWRCPPERVTPRSPMIVS